MARQPGHGRHQGWSINLFTTTSDMFPKKVLASVVGIGGFAWRSVESDFRSSPVGSSVTRTSGTHRCSGSAVWHICWPSAYVHLLVPR